MTFAPRSPLPGSASTGFGRHAALGGPLDVRHLIIEGGDRHPAGANGVHHVARRLVREQIHAGDDARLVLLRHPDRTDDPGIHDVPLTVLPLHGPRLRGRPLALDRQILEALLARTGPRTLFHVHGAREPLLIWLTRVFARRGIPYVVTVHGRYSHVDGTRGAPRAAVGLYLRLAERRVLQGARFVHAVSAEERALLRRFAPGARIELVANAAFSSALDAPPAPPAPRARRGDFPSFGYCGRYEIGHKGLDLLVQGFARYRAEGGGGRLTLVGTGPARATLQAMARDLAVADAVEVQGPKFGRDKALAHQDWDYFVQPSRFDGMPIGVLEAALEGLPLVVTAATGLLGPLGEFRAGFPIRAATPEAVALALGRAGRASHDEWSGLSLRAFAMACAIGDWTLNAARLRELYQDIPTPASHTELVPCASS